MPKRTLYDELYGPPPKPRKKYRAPKPKIAKTWQEEALADAGKIRCWERVYDIYGEQVDGPPPRPRDTRPYWKVWIASWFRPQF